MPGHWPVMSGAPNMPAAPPGEELGPVQRAEQETDGTPPARACRGRRGGKPVTCEGCTWMGQGGVSSRRENDSENL